MTPKEVVDRAREVIEAKANIWMGIDEGSWVAMQAGGEARAAPDFVEGAAGRLVRGDPKPSDLDTYIAHITGRRLRAEIDEECFLVSSRAARTLWEHHRDDH